LYHAGRSMGVCKGATSALSSGVEGVIGDGERERAFVREGEERDMGEIKKVREMNLCPLARSKRRRDATPARFRYEYHLCYL
jgi:hypothetical protein